jgi:protein O-GlcNAcase/histone acetyltransferase
MTVSETTSLLTGVIEGFYGQPWTQAERFELLDWMSQWGLNTYLYAPKDDLHQRAAWRELYAEAERAKLRHLIEACHQRNIRFIYSISPGLDIRYHDDTELNHLKTRCEQMRALGGRDFSLLFDDIPERMERQDLERFGSLASAQCYVANALFAWLRQKSPEGRMLFCPTAYCQRMAANKLGGADYLDRIGRELLPEIDVLWTGPEIISREITVSHIAELQAMLRRKPVIWDNLHANDYDGRRFFCGPYTGRPPELRKEVIGFLSNPNNEFPLNFVPLRTLADFASCKGAWDARASYLSAMREWFLKFKTRGEPICLEDFLYFGDCYYLPHEEGPEAEALFACARIAVSGNPSGQRGQLAAFRQRATRLRGVCSRLADLDDRPLFYALFRRIQDLREELDLLEQYVAFASENKDPGAAFRPNSHLSGTYRGGMVARLQALLIQQTDGTFTPAGWTNDLSATSKAAPQAAYSL